jgi:transposase InsO family protein
MSEKSNASAIAAIVKEASSTDVSDNADKILKEKFDKEFQSRLLKLQNMKFKTESDLVKRFPFPDELEEEDGVYTWFDYIVLSQDLVQGVLEAEWKELPNATGRQKFNSILKSKYIGISSPIIIAYLESNDEHQIYRQRRRSQVTKTTVAQAPFKQWSCDLTDIPKRGIYRYLFCVTDLFSKYLYVVPLAKKSGEIVARELDKILQSLPEGVRVGSLKSDNGNEFKNAEVRAVLAKTDTKQVFGLPHNPLGNGQIEGLNRVTKVNLFSDLNGDSKIGTFVPALKRCAKAYNDSISSSTGYQPTVLHRSNLPPEVVKDVLKRLNQNSAGRDVNARFQPPLMPGDRVRLTLESLDNEIKEQIKGGKFKSSHTQVYSDKVYIVVLQDKNNTVQVEGLNRKFPRGACLKVPNDAKDLSSGREPTRAEKRQKLATEPVEYVQKSRSRATAPLVSL